MPHTAIHERPDRLLRTVRWSAGVVILAWGIWTFDRESTAWSVLSTALFAAPLLMQWTRWRLVRAYALWFGAFLVLQSALTPALRTEFVALQPNMRGSVELVRADTPGMPPGKRRITTDARGFRVTPPVDYGAKRGLRVFVIGGSTTEEILLDDEATWTHLLQERLVRSSVPAEVINTGVSGLRAVNHLATLRVITRLEPDVVVFLLGGNDWNRHIRERYEPDLDAWSAVPLRRSVVVALLDRAIITPLRRKLWGKSWADSDLTLGGPQDLTKASPRTLGRKVQHVFRPAEVLPSYAQTLRDISRTCKEGRISCVFVTQPHAYGSNTPSDLVAQFWMTPPWATYTLDLESMHHIATLYNGFLATFATKEGHPLCDLAPAIQPTRTLLYDDMHFTDEGAKRVSEIVLQCVLAAVEKKR